MTIDMLAIFALAALRCGFMLAREEGPFKIFSRIRRTAGSDFVAVSDIPREGIPGNYVVEQQTILGENGHPEIIPVIAIPNNNLARGVYCIYCNTVWFSIFFVGLFLILGNIALYIAAPLATAMLAIMFNAILD